MKQVGCMGSMWWRNRVCSMGYGVVKYVVCRILHMGRQPKTQHTIYNIQYTRPGFTLLEVLLSVALLALLTGMGAPVYQAMQNRNSLDISTNSLVQSLRRAQLLSQASEGDSSWGVKVQSGSIVLFRGSSYAARNAGYDEIFDIPTNIILSGVNEIVFDKLSGLPQTTGTMTLTSTAGETRNMTVNEKGMISY